MVTPQPAGLSPVAELHEQAARWRFFHDLFRFPCADQWRWLGEPRVADAWRLLATESVPAECPELPRPEDAAEYEQTFIATFEVGLPSPPCPLIESHWNRTYPAPQVLHENMLFFRRFGLALQSAANEPADHLRHQLEFLHYLCGLEARAREAGDIDGAAQTAWGRAEFMDRHVRCWLPTAAEGLARTQTGQWPAEWLGLLAAHVAAAA